MALAQEQNLERLLILHYKYLNAIYLIDRVLSLDMNWSNQYFSLQFHIQEY